MIKPKQFSLKTSFLSRVDWGIFGWGNIIAWEFRRHDPQNSSNCIVGMGTAISGNLAALICNFLTSTVVEILVNTPTT